MQDRKLATETSAAAKETEQLEDDGHRRIGLLQAGIVCPLHFFMSPAGRRALACGGAGPVEAEPGILLQDVPQRGARRPDGDGVPGAC